MSAHPHVTWGFDRTTHRYRHRAQGESESDCGQLGHPEGLVKHGWLSPRPRVSDSVDLDLGRREELASLYLVPQ